MDDLQISPELDCLESAGAAYTGNRDSMYTLQMEIVSLRIYNIACFPPCLGMDGEAGRKKTHLRTTRQ